VISFSEEKGMERGKEVKKRRTGGRGLQSGCKVE